MYSLHNTDGEKDLNPVFSQDVINALVGSENINAYSFALRFTPFNDLDHEKFKKYGQEAVETVNFWFTEVEAPFTSIYTTIQNAILSKHAIESIDEFLEAINNFKDNSTDANKQDVISPIDYYIEKILSPADKEIEPLNKKISDFQEKLADDSKHFTEINQALPTLIGENEKLVSETITNLNETEETIRELGQTIRTNKLALQDKGKAIVKAGICCAIPIINIGGAIAMAVLISEEKALQKERDSLEAKLEEAKKKSKLLTAQLVKLNKQMPILTTMSTQVPSLHKLAIKSMDVSQAIRRNWHQIRKDFESIKTNLTDINSETRSFFLKKIKRALVDNRAQLIQSIEDFKVSNTLGVAFDAESKKAFKNKLGLKSISISFQNSPIHSNLFYLPTQELYEAILKSEKNR